MGIWNKVKGIFMEEVEEEVDEPTRPIKKVNDKSTVAKKIENPEPVKHEEKIEEKNNDIPENTKITISNASKYFSSTL